MANSAFKQPSTTVPLPLSAGGTEADTAAGARTNLGLGTSDGPTFDHLHAGNGIATTGSSANANLSNSRTNETWVDTKIRFTYAGITYGVAVGTNQTNHASGDFVSGAIATFWVSG